MSAKEALLRALGLQGSVPQDNLGAWSWKREGRCDEEKYEDVYELEVGDHLLSFEQGRSSIGTTIWDGSIVMAKYLEHACGNTIPAIKGKSCIELGSGSQALPGLAASALGSSRVVVSDTGHEIIRLLSTNVKRNAGACKGRSVEAKDHFWGGEVGGLGGPFDWILVAEFCYIDDAMKPLVDSMRRLSHGGTTVVCSYGRNRRSEDVFKAYAARFFDIREVPFAEWHPRYIDNEQSLLLLSPSPSLLSSTGWSCAPACGGKQSKRGKKRAGEGEREGEREGGGELMLGRRSLTKRLNGGSGSGCA